MADSKMAKMSKDEEHSLAVNGMAWRVKYRRTDAEGKVIRKKMPIGSLGVHQKNRGGLYPAGRRCKNLCIEVLDVGFLKENVEHAVIAVEEIPMEVARSRGEKFESGAQYNIRQCRKDTELMHCFDVPYNDVRSLMLSHNHITLVLRAFMTKAQWAIPKNEEKNLALCDANGKLSISAVAQHSNGVELAEMITEGLDCEQLSYEMDLEEPTAASIISQALNTAQELALRTSELTAVAVLKGEIIVQMGKDLSQKVAYKSVLPRVRRELKVVADDPDLPDVFDYLRSLGVGKNTYVDRLLQFGAAFVDSKKRQLRFSAFAVANKINHDYPLSRIAVIERAYRKKLVNGFCPNPEAKWEHIELTALEKLEQMLFYFHTTRRVDLHKLASDEQNKLLANVDCAAADAFYGAATAKGKQKSSIRIVQDALLKSTLKYFEQLGGEQTADPKGEENQENEAAVAAKEGEAAVAARPEWIDFSKVALADADDDDRSSLPGSAANIPKFDERSGARLTAEEEFPTPVAPQQQSEALVLPWRTWMQDNKLGALEADKASAVAVLHGLHEGFDVTSQNIDIIYQNKQVKVVATVDVKQGLLWLPPCIPKQSRVVETSESPSSVTLEVTVLRSAVSAVNSPDGPILRTSKFKLTPEIKIPTLVGPQHAVAGAVNENYSDDGKWILNEGTPDTLPPFWAVRRLTQQQLDKERSAAKPGEWLPRFTCKIVNQKISDVCVYTMIHMENRTRTFAVPFMTIASDLGCGEELILEITNKAKKEKVRTWRNVMKEEENRNKRTRTKQEDPNKAVDLD